MDICIYLFAFQFFLQLPVMTTYDRPRIKIPEFIHEIKIAQQNEPKLSNIFCLCSWCIGICNVHFKIPFFEFVTSCKRMKIVCISTFVIKEYNIH